MEKRAQGRQQEKQSWDVDSGEEFRIRTLKENPKETWMSPLRPGLARMLRSPSQHTLLRFYQTEGSFIRPKKHLDSFLCADGHYLSTPGASKESG